MRRKWIDASDVLDALPLADNDRLAHWVRLSALARRRGTYPLVRVFVWDLRTLFGKAHTPAIERALDELIDYRLVQVERQERDGDADSWQVTILEAPEPRATLIA